MKQPYIMPARGGWWHAYASKWAWWCGKEPILRFRSWGAMEAAVESMKQAKSRGRLVTV